MHTVLALLEKYQQSVCVCVCVCVCVSACLSVSVYVSISIEISVSLSLPSYTVSDFIPEQKDESDNYEKFHE